MASSLSALLALSSIFLLLALLPHGSEGLYCWVCSSDVNDACGDPFNTTSRYLVTDCDRDRAHTAYLRSSPVCRKYKHKAHRDSSEVIVVRSCAWSTEGDTDGPCSPSALHFVQDVESCSVCTTDQCNSANSLDGPVMTSLISLAVGLLGLRLASA